MSESTTSIRVRYCETDQMGTFYNARALDWFEVGRTELLRNSGISYAEIEKQGIMLPLVQAHVNFMGRARYDDKLLIVTTVKPDGKASLRFDCHIRHEDTGKAVADGYTVHAVTDTVGKPTRPPKWMLELFNN
ncbi:MAG TPA: thioesterase family protein [Phycisphaerae bacterium]|nr:thioesterase family protein [Phycisphaerae bacterium]